ncbi:uncharacterized protein LOC111398241 [Olea europaea var. sylvestris]|uniref:uncharacterized protein LOC111398241 n=1 Tax=Olea europaea var. sylvestris TaxID=158386 RepID=UPI000C1D3CE3|nr:uncharacterized protein LOC111398241 [Olea europaea var. sylvestris]
MAVKVMKSEEIEAITTRSGVKLPDITIERQVIENKKAPFKDEEQVDKSEQLDKVIISQELENLQVKTTAMKLHVNIPLIEAISQISNYAKFLKEILSKKRRHTDFETIKLNEEYSAILQNKLPPKLQDPRSLKIPCSIGNDSNFNCLCDSSATLLNLGKSFQSTSRAVMDFESGKLTLRVEDKQEKFKIYKNIKNPLQEEISKKAKEECKFIAVNIQQDSKETGLKHIVSLG